MRLRSEDEAVDWILRHLGHDLRVALPLGLGKPVTLVNALTRRACVDPRIRLHIFTALTLERPRPAEGLERRFLEPALDRLFGDYPQIDYARLLHDKELPDNITVTEFFFQAPNWMGVAQAQQDYVSVNYTHALDLLRAQPPNLVLQLVAGQGDRLSLSCNADVTVDLLKLRRRGEMDFALIAQTHPDLPFMAGEAEIAPEDCAVLLEGGKPHDLFSVVKQPVSLRDHAIGLHVSRLVRDGGSLQIGIGQIGDAVANALLLRAQGRIAPIWEDCPFPSEDFTETGGFETGLYGVTEMLVDGLLALFEEGVIRRQVGGAAIHAGFFLDSRDFYARLRDMPPERRDRIAMMPVSFTNALYGGEAARRAARHDARFVNSAMMVTLLGAAVSDGTEDGRVVSGVGGQFNFVDQAFALEGARSIITLPATRKDGGEVTSNLRWSYGHVTIPRHLRDIVVTEYGIADLRGKSDAETIAALLAVADSRFQPALTRQAQEAGKLPQGFRLPEAARRNLPDRLEGWLGRHRDAALPRFPFGTDFTRTEQRLLPALDLLRHAGRAERLRLILRGLGGALDEPDQLAMRRMELEAPAGFRAHLQASALRGALRSVPAEG